MKVVGKQLAAEIVNRQIVTAIVPTTGQTQTFNTANRDEQLYLEPAGTLAAQTFVLPPDVSSVIGQKCRIFTAQTLTATTMSAAGQTLKGTMTTLAANGNACWTKVAAAKWARTQ